MAVVAMKPYVGVPRDVVANFNGMQLVYASWDHHLLFASSLMMCLPPQMKFREFVEGPLTVLLQPDPDAGKIEWNKVQWLKSDQAFTPDFEASLKDNGIVHKALLRFKTPGLNSLLKQGA